MSWVSSLLSAAGSAFGGGGSSLLSSAMDMWGASESWQKQKRLAQEGIQWRVADAKAAGIHPLYALGAQPVPFAGTSFDGSGLREMGQDISRAKLAAMTDAERRASAELALRSEAREVEAHGLAMERARLENLELSSRIARTNSAQLGPGAPVSRNAPAGTVVRTPSEVITGAVGNQGRQPGGMTTFRYGWNGDGSIGVFRSQDAAEALEDDFIGNSLWQLRNNILPMIGGPFGPPPAPPTHEFPNRPGYHWAWDPNTGAFYERRNRRTLRRRQAPSLPIPQFGP